MKKLLIIFLCLILIPHAAFAQANQAIKLDIIFSYECTHNMGELGEEGGFLLVLLENGYIKYSQLLVGESKPAYTDTYRIDKKYVEQIESIIDNSKLEAVPTVLYNGTEDGITNNIGLKGMYYLASNIMYTTDEYLEKLDPSKKQNALYENQLLAVFEDIQKVFSEAGFELNLESFKKIEK